MRTLSLAIALPVLAGLSAFGCSSQTAEDTESSSNAVVSDLDLARSAVTNISGGGARCTSCHTAGKDEIARWGAAMKAVEDTCLAPGLTLTAQERVDCLLEKSDETPRYSAGKLGLYSAGAAGAQFADLFKAAYPASEWEAKYAAFKNDAGMPAFGGPAMPEADFAKVKEWVLKGMPKLDEVMLEPSSAPCVERSSPMMGEHMEQMKNEGWGARLAEASTPMANCGAATNAAECMKEFDDITSDWNAEGTDQTLRMVRRLEFRTSFWVRTSADGRFSSFGGSPSKIVDNQAPLSTPPIKADAPYDPGFFPNNDGFSFAGTGAGGLRVCKQSVLLAAASSPERRITFAEAGCTQIINTVYQSVGAALDGSLFFMATGAHTNDAGGASGPLSASFGADAKTTLTPMFNDGTKYVPGKNVLVTFPHEGDQQMSASNSLLITRFGQKAGFSGYRVRKLTATITPAPAGATGAAALPTVSVASKEMATVCLQGGKPQLSFDERFIAVHQFVDPAANPDQLPANTSNIFLVDLKTGKHTQVTKMKASQRALYPHWRADGWLYFLVKDSATGKESLVASDVALRQQ